MKTYGIIAVFIYCALFSCGQNRSAKEANLITALRDSTLKSHLVLYVDRGWNMRDTTAVRALGTPDFEREMNGIKVAGTLREMQSHMAVFFQAFPDLRIDLQEAFKTEQGLLIEWTAEGTNTGIYGEVGPTGKKMSVDGVSQLFFNENGKLYREKVFYNELDLLQQLGYILVPPQLE